MKKKLILTVLTMIITTFLFSSQLPFIPTYFHEKVIIVCFEKGSVDNKEGFLESEIVDGIVKTNLSSFNDLSHHYRFVDLKQFIGPVKNLDWNNDGVYIQNIYRVFLENNDNIESAQEALSYDPNIIYAEYESINRLKYTPNDPSFSSQWHLPQISCPETWDYSFGSEEIIIGIVDAGIKWNHPDLRDNIWINQAELDAGMTINWANGTISGGNNIDDDGNGEIDDVIGYNFFGADNNNSYQSFPDNDHGTHVAGCAGAVGDNGIGVCGSSLIVKLISSRHAPTTYDYPYVQDGYSGIIYCAESGANIINCSWGGQGSGTTPNNVVTYATSLGALVVTAAGNDNIEHNESYHDYPSDCTDALCVAALEQNDLKANFSDYGSPIDICAPGVDIKSTIIGGTGYASYQGTSMSSPIVAGVAALVKSIHSDLSPLQIRQRIMDTSDYIYDINPGYVGLLGAGKVNAFTATMYDLIPKLDIVSYEVTEEIGDSDGIPNPGETVNLTLLLQNAIFSAGFWSAATDVEITFTTEMAGVTIVEGTEVVYIDYIGQASYASTADSPVQIITETEENELEIPITVTITANPGSDYPYHSVKEIIVHLSLYQAGWPYEMNGSSTSSAVIIDINNDGQNEVVFADNNGCLHAFEENGVTELNNFPVNFEEHPGTISSAVAVGNINSDDYQEIIVANEAGYIFAVDYNGNIIFTYYAGGQFKSNPIIADVNNDEINEIIAFTFTSAKAIVLNADGTDFGNFPVTLSSGILCSAAAGDLNNDYNMELVVTSVNGTTSAISTENGENIAGWPYSLGNGSWNGPIISNIDSDNNPEILVATLNGKIVAINHDGTLNFQRNIGGQIKTSVVTSDLDGNNTIEIVFVSSNGDLYVIDNEGNDINENFPYAIDSQVESTPLLADMDNNGTIDIIFGDADGYIHSVDIYGTETANFPTFVQTSVKISASIGDVDNDDDPEIAVSNQSSYILLDYKRPIGAILWSCFKYDPARTGNNFLSVSSYEENIISNFSTTLGKNYPNPFNPETTIEFSLQNDCNVSLNIYNIKGQKVKTLVNEYKKTGYHQTVWNGTDNFDKKVSNGIYLYELKADKSTFIRKMLMLK